MSNVVDVLYWLVLGCFMVGGIMGSVLVGTCLVFWAMDGIQGKGND